MPVHTSDVIIPRIGTARVIVRSALLLALLVWFGATLSGCRPTTGVEAREASSPDAVDRGRYLVTIIGCNDCHTPWTLGENGPEPDMGRMLSGHPEEIGPLTPPPLEGPWVMAMAGTNTAWAGPWGVSYPANLTPDQNTGLGIWTEDMFIKALRTGRHFGVSRPINPPMPWFAYRNMTDEDLKAIFAYLRSIPPVVNHVPDYIEPPQTEG